MFSFTRKSTRRNPWENRFIPRLEQFEDRLTPNAATVTWDPAGVNLLWSNPANWIDDQGQRGAMPDATKVVILDGGTPTRNSNVNFTFGVPEVNRTVAGIVTSNGYSGTLSLAGGGFLTVSSLPNDNTTGFKWGVDAFNPNIAQTAETTLVITGGGSADNNKWSGGTINNTSNLSNLYIQGHTTLLITQGAVALGSNIFVGADFDGDSVLQFKDQNRTLQVNNNAFIKVEDNPSDLTGPNKLLFDGDVTQPNMQPKGLGTPLDAQGNTLSFIDNYGVITRSNPGTYQIELPIRNQVTAYQTPTLDLQSDLWISGKSNHTGGASLYQEYGRTILENMAELKVDHSVQIMAGELLTYGGPLARIIGSLDFRGGTLKMSADNPESYGALWITGTMYWFGSGSPTIEIYLRGNQAPISTSLNVGNLTTMNSAHLHLNIVGNLIGGQAWTPIGTLPGGRIQGEPNFDNANLFTVEYIPANNPSQITVRSRRAPQMGAVNPNMGAPFGGNAVVLTGSDFTGATQVMFGDVAAQSFTVDSDTQITAIAPPGAPGTVDIVVTNYFGSSEITSADQYTFSDGPLQFSLPGLLDWNEELSELAGDVTLTFTSTVEWLPMWSGNPMWISQDYSINGDTWTWVYMQSGIYTVVGLFKNHDETLPAIYYGGNTGTMPTMEIFFWDQQNSPADFTNFYYIEISLL